MPLIPACGEQKQANLHLRTKHSCRSSSSSHKQQLAKAMNGHFCKDNIQMADRCMQKSLITWKYKPDTRDTTSPVLMSSVEEEGKESSASDGVGTRDPWWDASKLCLMAMSTESPQTTRTTI